MLEWIILNIVNINMCRGFAGMAVIFLEQGLDFLKIIAVDGYNNDTLDVNLGLKLAGIS